MNDANPLSGADAFAAGDYLYAARVTAPDEWQHWASLALLGRPAEAFDQLSRFTAPPALFHAGVAAWIAGEDATALSLLARCDTEHAASLAGLIRATPLDVVAQLPWQRQRSSWDLLGSLEDAAFRVHNISFDSRDIPNRPYADASRILPAHVRPAFYIAEMLEWHLIPPNVRAFGCPIFGHSSDYDFHIQTVAPWLHVFDELLVLDTVEWRHMTGLVSVPVSVFPRVFGVPGGLPGLLDVERSVDVFMSGTVMHPCHPDKDEIVAGILHDTDLRVRMVNGFDAADSYYRNLAESKVCCTYVRHPGGLPTRGLEALAMGCVVAVQEENVLRLFLDEESGLVIYSAAAGDLGRKVRDVLRDWPLYRTRALRGSEVVRREFALPRLASQYFRFLTYLAARPRTSRVGPDPDSLIQRRTIVQKGWLPSYDFGGPLLTSWARETTSRLERLCAVEESATRLNDLAREHVLANYHTRTTPYDPKWLHLAASPLRHAIRAFPLELVPRFNLIRILIHFGGPASVREGIELLDDTLARPAAEWQIAPLDDVFPWDFCPMYFNYRHYFDVVTSALSSGEPKRAELVTLVLASLNHYRARYADEVPGKLSNLEWARTAADLDPRFAEYTLYYCRLLVDRGLPGDFEEVRGHLTKWMRKSTRVIEMLELARHLPSDLHGDWLRDLQIVASRFWTATEMKDDVPVPPWRPARLRGTEDGARRSHGPKETGSTPVARGSGRGVLGPEFLGPASVVLDAAPLVEAEWFHERPGLAGPTVIVVASDGEIYSRVQRRVRERVLRHVRCVRADIADSAGVRVLEKTARQVGGVDVLRLPARPEVVAAAKPLLERFRPVLVLCSSGREDASEAEFSSIRRMLGTLIASWSPPGPSRIPEHAIALLVADAPAAAPEVQCRL